MSKFKILVLVGSTRRDSINRKLAQALGKLGGDRFALSQARVDDLPLYNQDLEADLPASVARFKAQIAAADAVLFVTPEHSRSIPAALKNALDWGARPWGKYSWTGKLAAVTGTSPGAIGTAIAQQHLKQILAAQGVLVMGGEHYVAFRPDLLGADDTIADEGTRKFLQGFVDQLAALLARFSDQAIAA